MLMFFSRALAELRLQSLDFQRVWGSQPEQTRALWCCQHGRERGHLLKSAVSAAGDSVTELSAPLPKSD